MDWTIDYLQEHGIVLVKILNPPKIEDIKLLSQQMQSLAREHNSNKYLVDHREVDTGMYVSDIAKLSGIAKAVGINPKSKIALLAGPSVPQRFKLDFVQNVLALVSLKINFFYDEDEALDWLKSA